MFACAIVVLVEDLLNDENLFGVDTSTEDVQPQMAVEVDHDLEDRVPISTSLGVSPQKSTGEGGGEASQQAEKWGREETSQEKMGNDGKKKKSSKKARFADPLA